MLDTQGKLFPFRQHSPFEVTKLFSLDGTGMNGLFVAFETGNSAPLDSDGAWSTTAPGATFNYTTSVRYVNKRFVRPTLGTDYKWNCAGVTLYNVQEYDQHGNKLVLQPPSRWDELGCVPSGYTVPILSRGIIDLSISAINGTPLPGYVGVLTGTAGATAGKIAAVDPSTLVPILMTTAEMFGYAATGRFQERIVGRFLSSTGSAFGGHVQFHLEV
jgi:hypothetical protein